MLKATDANAAEMFSAGVFVNGKSASSRRLKEVNLERFKRGARLLLRALFRLLRRGALDIEGGADVVGFGWVFNLLLSVMYGGLIASCTEHTPTLKIVVEVVCD